MGCLQAQKQERSRSDASFRAGIQVGERLLQHIRAGDRMCRVASAGDLKAAYYHLYVWVDWGSKLGAFFRVGGQLVFSCPPGLVVRSSDYTLCGRPVSIATPSHRICHPPANHHPLPSRSSSSEVCLPRLSLQHDSPSFACHSQACARKVAHHPSTTGMASPRISPHACTAHYATSPRCPSSTA